MILNVTGIIVEYNPMHKGHLHHINLCKKAINPDAIVAVMSGNFVQRGAPAVIDKWTRAKLALENGIDLLIELPVIYSLSSAEFFAYGAVSLLNALGIVDNICFGSENTDIDKIKYISEFLIKEPESYRQNLKNYLSAGLDFPTARTCSLKESLGELHKYLETPNSILGIEYCKSLIKLDSKIKPYAVERDRNLLSSSEIRRRLKSGNCSNSLKEYIPQNVFNLIDDLKNSGFDFDHSNGILKFIKYKYYTSKENIRNLPDVSEGLENRIYKAIEKSTNFEELIQIIKTKRYTYSRLSRIMTQYFIGFDFYNTRSMRKKECEYARILGFNEKGAELLRMAKSASSIPLITKVKRGEFEALDLDLQATRAYSLINKKIRYNEDYYTGPIIHKNSKSKNPL